MTRFTTTCQPTKSVHNHRKPTGDEPTHNGNDVDTLTIVLDTLAIVYACYMTQHDCKKCFNNSINATRNKQKEKKYAHETEQNGKILVKEIEHQATDINKYDFQCTDDCAPTGNSFKIKFDINPSVTAWISQTCFLIARLPISPLHYTKDKRF